MVNNTDYIIAVWNGTSGGTKNGIDYANSQGRKVVYIIIDI